jgi:glycosyltransferase involved in cell wall biosynthesis
MQLSVIVCTRNRSHAVIGCLDSIARALKNASPIQAEIVVVDNGSSDDTAVVINKWRESSEFPVRIVFEPRKGLSRSRNCGIRASQGLLLAFTDDDCRLSPDYVKKLLFYDAEDSVPVLRGGRVELGDTRDLPLSIKTTPSFVQRSFRLDSARREDISNTLIGCNMTMRRKITEWLGPFDERFGAGSSFPAGDETDYIFRAYLAGIAIEYVPDMTVYHFHGRREIAEGQALMRNYSIGAGALYAKYIFKDLNLCRPFFWDLKKAFKELRPGKNTFLPIVKFSHRDWIGYAIVGMIRYATLTVLQKISSSQTSP